MCKSLLLCGGVCVVVGDGIYGVVVGVVVDVVVGVVVRRGVVCGVSVVCGVGCVVGDGVALLLVVSSLVLPVPPIASGVVGAMSPVLFVGQ